MYRTLTIHCRKLTPKLESMYLQVARSAKHSLPIYTVPHSRTHPRSTSQTKHNSPTRPLADPSSTIRPRFVHFHSLQLRTNTIVLTGKSDLSQSFVFQFLLISSWHLSSPTSHPTVTSTHLILSSPNQLQLSITHTSKPSNLNEARNDKNVFIRLTGDLGVSNYNLRTNQPHHPDNTLHSFTSSSTTLSLHTVSNRTPSAPPPAHIFCSGTVSHFSFRDIDVGNIINIYLRQVADDDKNAARNPEFIAVNNISLQWTWSFVCTIWISAEVRNAITLTPTGVVAVGRQRKLVYRFCLSSTLILMFCFVFCFFSFLISVFLSCFVSWDLCYLFFVFWVLYFVFCVIEFVFCIMKIVNCFILYSVSILWD